MVIIWAVCGVYVVQVSFRGLEERGLTRRISKIVTLLTVKTRKSTNPILGM